MFSRVLRSASALASRHFGSIFTISLVCYSASFTVLFVIGRGLRTILERPGVPLDPTQVWYSAGWPFKVFMLLLFVVFAWTPLLMSCAGIGWLAVRERLGEVYSVGGAMRYAIQKTHIAILLALVFGIPALLGTFLFVIPGLLIASLGMMVMPELVTADLSLGQSVRSGMRVGRKFMLGIAATNLVISLAAFAAVGLLSGILIAISPVLGVAMYPLLGALIASCLGSVVTAISLEHGAISAAFKGAPVQPVGMAGVSQ